MTPSIYVHIPFCRTRCTYCNFYFRVARGGPDFLDALLTELRTRAGEIGEGPAPAIYLGGGTPSWLPRDLLARLLEALSPWRGPETEFSIEVNPEDLDEELLDLLAGAGVNRISLGVQSLDDLELKRSARRHNAAGARRALGLLARSGLSWSADLIIGLPEQREANFHRSLEEILGHEPGHLSVYTLELDSRAPLAEVFKRRPEWDPGEDFRAELYLWTHDRLVRAGFEHYEVSNFARPGRRCRYNESVWAGGEYVGLGPSAASHRGGRRWSSPSDLEAWMGALRAGRAPTVLADLRDPASIHLERLLLSLRTSGGLDAGDVALEGREDLLRAFEEAGWAACKEGRWRLHPSGWLRLDGILARLTS